MAKKQEKVEVPVVETPVVETPKPKKVEPAKPKWEIKDRTYLQFEPHGLTHTLSSNCYYFDEEKGYRRQVQITRNQLTPFVDEFKGDVILDHITFRDGVLVVPKEQVVLQKILSLYHEHKDVKYYEYNAEEEAKEELVDIDLELDAMVAARNADLDTAEAILRVDIGSEVSSMTSKEIKRDILIYAKNNPKVFLDLLNDDNVVLRNFGIKATEEGLLVLSADQRTFYWGSNNRKLMNVPFDEHPYSALAAWFKTDEGMEVYKNIEKQLK